MIVTLCAILALKQQGTPPAPQSGTSRPAYDTPAGQLIKKMVDHYASAKSLSAKIKLTQSARGFSITIDSTVAFDQPDRMLIRQVKTGGNPGSWLVISDGKTFSYPKPENINGPSRFVENVNQLAGHQDVREMYGVSGTTIPDRSAVLDVLFGRAEDMEMYYPRWRGFKFGQPIKIRGVECQVVEGDYCDNADNQPTGKFTLAITADGDLLRYTTTNKYQAPSDPPQVVEVLSVWDVDAKINVANPDSTYTGG